MPDVGGPVGFAVVGATGFIGAAVVERPSLRHDAVRPIPAPRIAVPFGAPPSAAAQQWMAANPDAYQALVTAIADSAVVINAAGLATATAAASDELWGANAVLPAVVATAAVDAGAERVLHVSSAAVQGSQRSLDERPFTGRAHSPYARAKGAGERAATFATAGTTTRCVVYRPPSVLGRQRPIAGRLVRVLRSRWLVVPAGDIPLPVAHIDNVARAIEFLAVVADPPPIVAHPSEGMTTANLAVAFGRPTRIRRLRGPISWLAVRTVRLLARGGPVAGQARRIELLWDGQTQRSSLPGLGFATPDAVAAFTKLGDQLG